MNPALQLSRDVRSDRGVDASEEPANGVGSIGFAAALSALTDGLDALLGATGVPELTNDDLVAVTAVLEGHARRVEALQVAVASEIEERTTGRTPTECLATNLGCRSGVELLQRLTHCSARTIRQRLSLGRQVRGRAGFSAGLLPSQFPTVADAFVGGSLSMESARVITGLLGGVPSSTDPHRLVVAEQCLVAAATGVPPAPGSAAAERWDPADGGSDGAEDGVPMHTDSVRAMCEVWKQFLDPDGTLPDEEAAFTKRGFRFGAERDGLVKVTGALTVEVAALLGRVFDAVNSPRTTTNTTDGGSSGAEERDGGRVGDRYADSSYDSSSSGDGRVRFRPVTEAAQAAPPSGAGAGVPALDGDERSSDQKRHDALATVLQTIARHPDTPLLGGAPVTVLVQVTEETLTAKTPAAATWAATPAAPTTATLEGVIGRVAADRRPGSPAGGSAWLHGHDGTLRAISTRAAHHAVCAGTTQRITQDAGGRILGIGSPQRIFTPHQRRAITLRDGGCVIPDCTTPASWCEIHHVTEHQDGGETHTDNGVLLCWFHHRTLDTSGWRVRMAAGAPEVRAPEWIDPRGRWRRPHPPGRPPGLPRRTPN